MERKLKSRKTFRHNLLYENGEAAKPEENGMLSSFVLYDEAGNKISEISYDNEGDVIEKSVFKYDDNNRLTEEIVFFDENIEAEHIFYKWNEKGLIITADKNYQDGTLEKIHYKYNDADQLIGKKALDEEGECEWEEARAYEGDKIILETRFEYGDLISEIRYSFDENGFKTEIWKKEHDDDAVSQKFFYDEKGNNVKTLTYNSRNQLVSKLLAEYDEENRVVSLNEEDAGKNNTSIIEYDENGNALLQQEVNREGEVNNSIKRTYDENKLLVESEVYVNLHGKGRNPHYVVRYHYEYFP